MNEKGMKSKPLTRRELLKLAGGAAAASALAPFQAITGEQNTDRPNIVLIMADDMGWSDAGCYGGEVNTPHLDGLASEGLRFSQFYVNPVCVPTRGALMTGLYCYVGERNTHLSRNMATVPQLLRSAGYRTSLSGKWNVPVVGSPLDWGFEELYGFEDIPSNYLNPALKCLKIDGFRQPVMHNRKVVSEFSDDYYMTDAINDHAVEMIERFSKDKNPFFVYVSHFAPHNPIQAKQEDIEKYQGKFMAGWDVLRKERHQRQLDMGLVDPAWQLSDHSPNVSRWAEEEHKEWQDLRAAIYAGMVDCMDQGIGRIMQALRDSGVDQNTIVLFLSDNGGDAGEKKERDRPDIIPGGVDTYSSCGPGWGALHNTPFRGSKGGLYEGGIASPLIVRWPGTTKSGGATTHQFGHAMDIMPTLCEVASIEYPEEYEGQVLDPCEGKSLVPVFQGKQRDGHEWLVWEQSSRRAVRHGNWKLIGHGSPGGPNDWELYDLEADRLETDDLAQKQPERLKQMAEAWHDWAKRMGEG